MSKIYISGKITGLEYGEAFRAFEQAENLLRDLGLEPVNPMKKVSEQEGLSWAEYMKEDIPLLLECDGIYLLPNWMDSKGARLERHIAAELGLRIIHAGSETDETGDFFRCDECDFGWATLEDAVRCCRPQTAIAA